MVLNQKIYLHFDKSVRSSENGSFELSDMAAKLSTQMAAASKLGMRGLQDYDKLLAMNQANALTSGTPDSAATNVENYLNKITSADTQNSMKNYRFRGKDGQDGPLYGVSITTAFARCEHF